MKKAPDLERLGAIFADMPCTNREAAAEKAAAHEWLKKRRAGLRSRNLRKLEKLRKAFAEFEAEQAARRR